MSRRAQFRHPTNELDGVFAERLMDLQDYDWLHNRRIRKWIFIESGPRIAAARNRVVEQWLTDPASTWLWMLDTDMTFTPDTLDRLLDAADPVERPIVGGLCFAGGRDFRIAPTIYVATLTRRPARELEELEDLTSPQGRSRSPFGAFSGLDPRRPEPPAREKPWRRARAGGGSVEPVARVGGKRDRRAVRDRVDERLQGRRHIGCAGHVDVGRVQPATGTGERGDARR